LVTALYAGSFDPVTNGHLDIARRAAGIFEHLIVGVAQDTPKNLLFSTEERVAFFREAIDDLDNVKVITYSGLTVEFARKLGASVLVRSMRAVTDFHDEFDQALMNRKMAPEIESVFLMGALENLFISGTRIRELAALGRDVSDLVPNHVARALKKKFAGQPQE
jgi:pantetheine-phosphate adenylyltransferase